ncbi:hypothetical protein IPG41_06080 [Candidatus Peregrinibacteria bacterium]|nr:MAG: hypothetical protein IPG41_06080 [Candidatus Peregrinibacteria bacterium]
MNTTISIDKKTRDRAAKRAKREKISVSAIVRILLTDYAEGRIQIGTRIPMQIESSEIAVDGETQTLMDDVLNTWSKIR